MVLSDVCVLIGIRGAGAAGVNCQGCGFPTCTDFQAAFAQKGPANVL